MNHNAYAVHDTKSHSYGPPMFLRHGAEAMRSFEQAANDEQTMLFKYPDDYELVRIGHYNDDTGTLVSEEHISLGFARDFQKPKKQTLLPFPPPAKEPANG